MALDALWAVLIPEVSEESDIQERDAHAALIGGSDTPDTPQKNVGYQAKPNIHAGCTPDTPDTCKIIDTEADAANQLLYGDLLTGWNVTIPHGTTAATLAKFRAASLALDASIVAAGGSLELPCEQQATITQSTRLNFQTI